MKTLLKHLLTISFAFILFVSKSETLNTSAIASENFNAALQRIIQAALVNKMSSLKGSMIVATTNGPSSIEKWQATDSLPGQKSGIIVKSFGISFRSIYSENKELSQELINQFAELNSFLQNSLPKAIWRAAAETREDGTRITTYCRVSESERTAWPVISAEIVNKKGIYIVQISVSAI
jgi:hypothetical protein